MKAPRGQDDPHCYFGRAVRTVFRNLRTSVMNWLLSLESDCADENTCVEAEPVSPALWFTSVMLVANCAVLFAASPTLISFGRPEYPRFICRSDDTSYNQQLCRML